MKYYKTYHYFVLPNSKHIYLQLIDEQHSNPDNFIRFNIKKVKCEPHKNCFLIQIIEFIANQVNYNYCKTFLHSSEKVLKIVFNSTQFFFN